MAEVTVGEEGGTDPTEIDTNMRRGRTRVEREGVEREGVERGRGLRGGGG